MDITQSVVSQGSYYEVKGQEMLQPVWNQQLTNADLTISLRVQSPSLVFEKFMKDTEGTGLGAASCHSRDVMAKTSNKTNNPQ